MLILFMILALLAQRPSLQGIRYTIYFQEATKLNPYIQPGQLFVFCSDKLTLNNSQCLIQNFTNCWRLDFQNLANAQKKFLVSQEGDDVLAETWDGAGNALTKHIAANGLEANFTFTTVISQTCLGEEKWGSELPEFRYICIFCLPRAFSLTFKHSGSVKDTPTPLR